VIEEAKRKKLGAAWMIVGEAALRRRAASMRWPTRLAV